MPDICGFLPKNNDTFFLEIHSMYASIPVASPR